MRIPYLLGALVLLLTVTTFAQTAPANSPQFKIDTMDKSIDPCTDFYQYACGDWLKTATIPPDQSEWASFIELEERNRDILRGILEKASVDNPNRDAITQKIGDYYSSCMDEATVDKEGIVPLQPELDRVAKVQNKQELIDAVARAYMIGPNPLFVFYSSPDLHDSSKVIGNLDQGGLTLPDRDYYIKDTPQMVQMRKTLTDYITQIFTLKGESGQQAFESAQTILRIETELAKASMDRTLRRDPKTQDHKMARKDADKLAPNFHLERYFHDIDAPSFNNVNVANPDFFKQVNGVIASESLDDLKTYVTWHLLNDAAPYLSQPFVDAHFKMRQALTGQKEQKARWKRCVSYVDRGLGEALGQKYVDLTFGADGKQRMLKMVDALEASLKTDIQDVSWMTPETKHEAELKLEAIKNKIGYPDKWRDYSKLKVERGDFLGNYFRANLFESHRQINKIGKPVDRDEWEMTPPTVNAYYSGAFNEIVFPAGILQPPFFDKSADEAVNYGSIGMVIGHELTHGFDDEGRKYDAQGNLHDWWTPQDAKAFESRASCIANEYGNFTAVDDLKLNGKLTLGENTADNGGARVALMALENTLAADKNSPAAKTLDGYTPEQRFFLGYARVWCEKRQPEYSRMLVSVDPHSPGKYRVDGVVQNMPEFQKAWGCKAGQPMVSQNACRVW